MIEENIKTLVEYINQNPNIPYNELINTCLQSDYTQEEIDKALEILGKSNLVDSQETSQSQPAISKDTITQSATLDTKSPKKISKVLLVGLFLLIITIGTSVGFIIFGNKIIKKTENVTPVPTITTSFPSTPSPLLNDSTRSSTFGSLQSPTAIPTTNTSADNPMSLFLPVFTSADFKVSTQGIIEIKGSGKEATTGGSTTMSSSSKLDLNDEVFYFKKGEIVRGENTTEEGKQETMLVIDNNLYFLDHDNKTYTQLNEKGQDASESMFYEIFKYSIPLVQLIEDSEANGILWEKTSEFKWRASWEYKFPITNQPTLPKIKIELDPETNYINKFAVKFKENQPWQEITFTYYKIENIDQLLLLPEGYSEKKLDY